MSKSKATLLTGFGQLFLIRSPPYSAVRVMSTFQSSEIFRNDSSKKCLRRQIQNRNDTHHQQNQTTNVTTTNKETNKQTTKQRKKKDRNKQSNKQRKKQTTNQTKPNQTIIKPSKQPCSHPHTSRRCISDCTSTAFCSSAFIWSCLWYYGGLGIELVLSVLSLSRTLSWALMVAMLA